MKRLNWKDLIGRLDHAWTGAGTAVVALVAQAPSTRSRKRPVSKLCPAG